MQQPVLSIDQVLARAQKCHEQGQLGEAAAIYAQILQVMPDHAEALHLLGALKHQVGDHAGAIALIGRATQIVPNESRYYTNLGSAFFHLGKVDQSVEILRKGLALNPSSPQAWRNLGIALHFTKDLQGEIDAYQEGLKHAPEDSGLLNELVKAKEEACDWADLDALRARLKKLTAREMRQEKAMGLTAFHSLVLYDTPEEQKRYAMAYAKRRFSRIEKSRGQLGFVHEAGERKRLRVGYVSADFRDHPTGHLMRSMFCHHNRENVEVIAYSIGKDDGSDFRKTIVAAADQHVDLTGQPPVEMAKRIYTDKVDVLLDVMGYIQNGITDIFALRPAPIQVSFLAYAGTMGAAFMDYLVTDSTVLPPGEEKHYVERPLCLPHTYFVTDDSLPEVQAVDRSELGLPEEAVVLCCFNKSYKVDAAVMDAWAEILHNAPKAVLWLFAHHPLIAENLKKEAIARGIAEDRFFIAPRIAKADHLKRLAAADLFLDCFHVPAHTTAIDALWAGVPVLTTRGKTLMGRGTESILKAHGMPEMVMDSREAYVSEAVRLVNDREALQVVRQKVATQRKAGHLFNTQGYVRSLEDGLWHAWQSYVKGKSAKAICAR